MEPLERNNYPHRAEITHLQMIDSGKTYYSIKEVAAEIGESEPTLRYWEKQFPVAIRPTTGAGGRRYYRTETVARLTVIRDLLYTHGMTIAGVKKLLRDGNLPTTADELLDGVSVPATVSSATPAVDNSELDLAIKLLENAKSILQ